MKLAKLVVLVIILLLFKVAFAQDNKWILRDCNYLKSFGDNYSIFLEQENYTYYHVILIEPAIESVFNKAFVDNKFGDKILVQAVCSVNDSVNFVDFEVITKKNGQMINDSITSNEIISVLKQSLKATILINRTDTKGAMFGFMLYRKND